MGRLDNLPQPDVASRALSEVIGSIYDCTLDPNLWDETLGAIRDAIESDNAVLSLTDLEQDRVLLTKSVGIEPYWLERILEHSSEINARLSDALAAWPSLDEPYIVSRHVSRDDLATSPYYNDCVRKQGLVDIINYFLMATPKRFSAFAAGRHERDGLYSERQIALTQLLMPHLRRAVTISNVLDVRAIERVRMAEALDTLQCGVVLINEAGTILHANRSAEDMMRAGRLLQGTGGVLGATEENAAKELRAAIKLAARNEAGIGNAGLAIPLTAPDEGTVFAHVLPLAGGDLRTRLQPEAVAAVFVAEPETRDGAHLIATAFGLTPAETRVLSGLVGGRTPADTASELGIAASTVRTHLESIFSKTGVGRQADLVRLAARLAPPTRPAG